MSNNKQAVDLTDITVSLPVATHGLTLEDRDASSSTPMIERITDVNQTPYYVDKSDDETIGFLLDCAKRGENRGNRRPPSICKVSRILRDLSVRSFIPQLVSIGPIHRENKMLKEFEWQKERYLNDLLNRSDSTPKETLEACLLKVKNLIPQIRESYADVKKNYSDVELARMTVLDGCFILEFCFKHKDVNLYLPNKMQNNRIAMDLMLLENQVPFFVLQALFDCCVGEVPFTTLSDVLDHYLAPYIKLFCSLLPEKIPTTDVDSDSTPAHVLGYLHKRYQLVDAKSSKPIQAETLMLEDEERIENTAFHSIVELDRSGMKFKPHQQYIWSMTFKFQPSGFRSYPTLLMPTLVIDDTTEIILRNFIAYEQSFPQGHYYFTSYAHAMDMLIDTQEDIAKLVQSKVLVNRLGSNQEAADMINKICKNITITEFHYTQEFKQMDTYYNGFWPNVIPQMRHRYFKDPWIVTTIVVFYLTLVQTTVAIMQVMNKSDRADGSNQ